MWLSAPEFKGWLKPIPLSKHFYYLREYLPILARKRNASIFMPLFESCVDEAEGLYEAGQVDAGRKKMG
jgi:hypothetical protein